MRRLILIPILFAATVCALPLMAETPAHTNETQLDAILQSSTNSVRNKSDACAQLKRIATDRSVKALAALLTNDQLSHSARYVLETIPGSKAGSALRRALGHTSGLIQVGIVNSLAIRRESGAVGSIARLLSSTNQDVALASAEALGRIGGPSAVKSLKTSFSKSTGPLHRAEADAILMCASRLLTTGDQSAALKLYQLVFDGEKTRAVREAAFGGIILSSGKDGLALTVNSIADTDDLKRSVALHVAFQLEGTEATRDFADLAVGAPQPVQLSLIECLVQRHDPAAMPALVNLADSADAAVRLAAISALGGLGDDSTVHLLAERAVSARGPERTAARESLIELNRGPVTRRILGMLDPNSPKIEAELIVALGSRGDRSATPTLLNLARQGNDDERSAALRALGQLADAGQIPTLVQMVVEASSDDRRSQAADALAAVYQRLPSALERDVAPLVQAVTTGSADARIALLPICSELSQVSVRGALRAAIVDSDTRIREAGIHALCDTHDPELLPDLIDLADGKAGDSARHLGIRGCVHLTSQEDDVKFSNEKKLSAYTNILNGSLDAAEKRLVLSGLAGVSDVKALNAAANLMDDPDVHTEAEKAVIDIARMVRTHHAKEVRAAFKKLLAESKDADNRQAAKDLLDKMK